MKTFIGTLLFFALTLCACEDSFFEEEPSNDPIGNFESLWNTFNERYAVFKQRGIDWNQLYDQYRPQVSNETSDDELYDILTSMLGHLNDGHVSLMANEKPFWRGFREFRERTKDKLFNLWVIPHNYLDGDFVNIDDQYFYGTIHGEMGYLYVNHLSGDKPGFVDEFVRQMADMKGMIIDLRHNGGGDFTNGEVIASRFAGSRTLAFSGTPKNGPGPNDYGKTTPYYIEADGPTQFSKPIVVLIDRYTISAGENLVLYLRALPQTVFIGANTTGAMGERIEKEMPNGWVYSISGQVITAADGVSYEGPGIPPDEYVENTFPEMEQKIDRVLERAIELLE